MLMNKRSENAWGHLSAIKDKNDSTSDPVGFLWFYDCAYPTTEMVQGAINHIVREKGDWTGDELSDSISRKWISCACKFLPYDGGDFFDFYAIDLDQYAGTTRK